MLKVRLIPTLLLKEGRMIKTKQFGTYRDVGNPTTVAKVYDAQKADELIFLDITATEQKRKILLDVISSVAQECFIPLTVGGGITTIEEAREILNHGADKIAINTRAVEQPEFVRAAAEKFGNSTVVVSIDYRVNSAGQNEVFTHRGTKATGLTSLAWARQVEGLGAGEILLTCIDKEGMMQGYDIETIRQVSESVSIPVIAHGGAGTVQDFVDVIKIGRASAVAAASIFHFTDQSIYKGHSFMSQAGIPVRI